ncbi:hypothetical protein [Reyranella sp.]|uniref:hypothetical protein n=1 Tax=Reyranella sp. TaxID=1929291 RepID=UPI003D09F709
MRLFFIIAIGAGAFTLGSTAVDVISDVSAQRRDRTVQAQRVQYQTMEQCLQAAAQQGLPAGSCQQRS